MQVTDFNINQTNHLLCLTLTFICKTCCKILPILQIEITDVAINQEPRFIIQGTNAEILVLRTQIHHTTL